METSRNKSKNISFRGNLHVRERLRSLASVELACAYTPEYAQDQFRCRISAYLLTQDCGARLGGQIQQTKSMVYAHCGIWWDTSNRENIDFLIRNLAVLGSAYILKQYGYFVWL